jgi:hypothetical protein
MMDGDVGVGQHSAVQIHCHQHAPRRSFPAKRTLNPFFLSLNTLYLKQGSHALNPVWTYPKSLVGSNSLQIQGQGLVTQGASAAGFKVNNNL